MQLKKHVGDLVGRLRKDPAPLIIQLSATEYDEFRRFMDDNEDRLNRTQAARLLLLKALKQNRATEATGGKR